MITSNKTSVNPLYVEAVRGEVRPTASYTLTAAWANATGFTLTIPVTGRYKIEMQGSLRCVNNGANNYGYVRLYNQTLGAAVANSARRYGVAIGAATSVDIHQNISGHWEENFTAGQVVNLQAYTDDATLSPQIRYQAGDSELLFSYELIEQVVPIADYPYSTNETATGKKWIDGRTIYSKVINFGALPDTTTKNVAHGISSINSFITLKGIATDGSNYYPMPSGRTTDTNNIDLFANGTNVSVTTATNWSTYSAYIVVEYTK